MRRFGRLEDLGGAVVFLCSDAAAYITGQIIYIDGGDAAREQRLRRARQSAQIVEGERIGWVHFLSIDRGDALRAGSRRRLAQDPAVAVRIFEHRETAPGLLFDRCELQTFGLQLLMITIDIGTVEHHALQTAGLHRVEPRDQGNRGRTTLGR